VSAGETAVSQRLPILMYHEVTPSPPADFRFYSVTPERFGQQMGFLARAGYSTLSLDLLAERSASGAPLPSRSVIITFDDGFKSCIEHAVPHLERFGFTAAFFAVAGLVGDASRWLRESIGRELALADWDALRRLAERGFTCGAHSMSHAHLTQLAPEACRSELAESKRTMEMQLGLPVVHMAYPYGEYSAEVRALAQEVGTTRRARSAEASRASMTTSTPCAVSPSVALTRCWISRGVSGQPNFPDSICGPKLAPPGNGREG